VDYSRLKDETLMQLIARAHPEALGELYDRYHRLVFSLALQIVEERATAEEITLDVFTRVWQKAVTYRAEQAQVTTWLSAITRYYAIDIRRRQNSRPDQQGMSWTELVEHNFLDSNNPEELTTLALQREQLQAAVAQLPAEQKQALTLAYFRGYTQSQIAELLGQPVGTVKTRLRLALQKLRRLLSEE
jgi:RNA polymerase sigma-70 factor, ECF subfamily